MLHFRILTMHSRVNTAKLKELVNKLILHACMIPRDYVHMMDADSSTFLYTIEKIHSQTDSLIHSMMLES